MSKKCLAAAALLALTSTAVAQAQPSCSGQPVQYEIAYLGGTDFTVTAEFPASAGLVDLSWRSSESAPDGQAEFISQLELRDLEGRWQTPTYLGEGSWQPVEGADAEYDALRYRLSATHDRVVWDIGKEEIAYRFDEAFYFIGSSVLIANYGWSDCGYEVDFDLPASWSSVAAWEGSEDGGYHTTSLNDLLRNIFVVGPNLEPQTMNLGGMEVVTLSQRALEPAAAQFQSLLGDSVSRYIEIFGSSPVDRYLAVFGVDGANDGGAFAQSFGQRMPAPLREYERLMWTRTLAHESLHNWIGITIRPESGSELQWFTEGGADYLTGKTLYRIGEIDEDDMIFILEGQVRRFLLGRIASGPISLAEAGVEKQRNRQLVYGGGALFHLFLDAEMTANQGAGSYEALLRQLYENADEPYSFDRMMTALNAASDGSASEIYGFLNGPFNPFAVLDRMTEIGLPTAAFGPDELLVRFAANGCTGSREAACMPGYLAR